MNPTALLIGLAGGVAAALLFAAVQGGGALAAPLFALSPLPIAIASLGWGTIAGGVAALGASAVVAGLTSGPAGLLFLIITGAPMAFYGHLAGLARPRDDANQAAGLEWYPLGRIFLALVVVTPVTIILAGLVVGVSVDDLAASMADALAAMGAEEAPGVPASRELLMEISRLSVRLMPVTITMLWLTLMVVNLWIAGRIVRASGRFARPAEKLYSVGRLPALAAVALAGVLPVTTLDGGAGLAAGAIAGGLSMGFALQGLATAHVLTLGNALRPMILGTIYTLTFLFSLPLLPLALLGVADSVTGIRQRRLNRP